MAFVKICGITNVEDALVAAEAGAGALGFVFYAKSKRYINPAEARKIISQLPPFVFTVGVFVDADVNMVAELAEYVGLDAVQLHGDESLAYCKALKRYRVIKAFRVGGPEDIACADRYRGIVDSVLYDAYTEGEPGGTGKTFPHKWLDSAVGDYFLAGGLNPENVADAVAAIKPFAVDVSSGVEIAPGKKDHEKVRRFICAAKGI